MDDEIAPLLPFSRPRYISHQEFMADPDVRAVLEAASRLGYEMLPGHAKQIAEAVRDRSDVVLERSYQILGEVWNGHPEDRKHFENRPLHDLYTKMADEDLIPTHRPTKSLHYISSLSGREIPAEAVKKAGSRMWIGGMPIDVKVRWQVKALKT